MSDLLAEIETFFAEFQTASEQEQWDRFDRLFLSTFFSLDPGSATPVERQALIAFLPHRRAIFEKAGATGTRLASLDVSELDPMHVLALTTWDVVYAEPHEPVTLRSTFLLRRTPHGWRIAVYLNHESLLALLGLDSAGS